MADYKFDCSFITTETFPHFYAPARADTSGIQTLFTNVSSDAEQWSNIYQVAYLLATVKWETMNTFQPIHEMGSLSYFDKYEPGTTIGSGLGNTQTGDGFLYRGRGYVQITGRENYTHIGQLVGVDLVNNPDLALEPATAYKIASQGMLHGWFTGRRLSQYTLPGSAPDFINARRIINGQDHASDIAAIAQSFVALLTPPPPSTPAQEIA